MLLRAQLPQSHLGPESKDVIKLAMGLAGTLIALVLGLLIWSAKSFHDTQTAELTQLFAQLVFLDRTPAHDGIESKEVRTLLPNAADRLPARTWSRDRGAASLDPTSLGSESLYETVQQRSPKNDAQRAAPMPALTIVTGIAQTSWLKYEQAAG